MTCTKTEVFSTMDFSSKRDQIRADLVTFNEGILNGKLHFLCSDDSVCNDESVSWCES